MLKATRLYRDLHSRRPEPRPSGAFRRESNRPRVRSVTTNWPPPAAETPSAQPTVSEALVEALVALGVEHAFGVFGGGIAPFCQAVSRSPIRLIHCRHEASAAFAAIE